MKRIIASAAVLALAACAYPEEPEAGPPDSLPDLAADMANPRLALMDHVLANYFAQDIPNRPTVCASANDGRNEEPLPQVDELKLIERYEALAPFSRCAFVDAAWKDAETDEPAVVFNMYNFTCASETSCTGFAGYMSGPTSSMAYRYTMAYADGYWSFERDPRILMDGE